MTSPIKKSLDALRWIPSWVMDLWIAWIVVAFLVIRVLGSGTAQRLLSHFGFRHP
jgi:hypothetical protein